MNDPTRSSTTLATGRRSARERRARERRVLWIGLAVSVGIHLIAIAVVGGWLEPKEPAPRRPVQTPVILEPPSGLREVDIVVREPGSPAEPERPTPRPAANPSRELATVPADTASTRTERLAADDITAAERLAPRVVDPRLWEPMVIIPKEPTIEDVEARIGAAVEMLSDSALAETERMLRARDWTVQDGKGGRWGISPGKLHLGKLTLPLPIWFATDPATDRENEMWYDLEAQVDRVKFLESFEDRVRAIRERREKEREDPESGGHGSG